MNSQHDSLPETVQKMLSMKKTLKTLVNADQGLQIQFVKIMREDTFPYEPASVHSALGLVENMLDDFDKKNPSFLLQYELLSADFLKTLDYFAVVAQVFHKLASWSNGNNFREQLQRNADSGLIACILEYEFIFFFPGIPHMPDKVSKSQYKEMSKKGKEAILWAPGYADQVRFE